jgi:hypothetical protein
MKRELDQQAQSNDQQSKGMYERKGMNEDDLQKLKLSSWLAVLIENPPLPKRYLTG